MLDAVIIGGGLAGATCATLLAGAGRDVVVLDPATFPRDKLCGEFLSPEAALTLQRLGCWNAILDARPPRLSSGWFTDRWGRGARVPLPAPGLGVSRLTLDDVLKQTTEASGATWRRAEALHATREADGSVRVEFREGSTTASVRARVAVGSYGRHGRLDRALGRRRRPKRFVGLKRHHLDPHRTADHRVEIHLFDGGYCGVNAVDGDRVNVCALVETRWLEALSSKDWTGVQEGLRRANPALAERLRPLQPDPDRGLLTVAGIDFARLEPTLEPLLMVGDGAAMIAPLAGDGQAMALRGAERLADLVLRTPAAELRPAWARDFVHHFGGRLGLGRRLQSLLLHPWGGAAMVRTSARFPRLPAWLARHTRETLPASPAWGGR
jgi:flavin-dependent dehydrogenase